MTIGKVLIDGDIIAYRSAFSTQDLYPEDAINKAKDLVTYTLGETLVFYTDADYQVYLTGRSNFRHEIAKTHPYKANRKDVPKPTHLGLVRNYLVEEWGAIVSDGEEADDLIAIEATRLGPTTIVASVDKDMLQIPCRHYNFVKGEWTEVDEFGGLKFFYQQILTGDAADNIKGIYGIGPKKAEKILDGCENEDDLWEAVLKAYDGNLDRVVENARLLWLRREEGQIWQPPDK
jgi:5'-3' exonuclease